MSTTILSAREFDNVSVSSPSHAFRRAVTLVELLIVVAVLAILLGAALTMLRPVMKDMKVREAARMVNAYLAGAQARAAELNRPVGVYIERFENKPGASFQLFMADSPPPYAGDSVTSRARLPGDANSATFVGENALLATLCSSGDYIRFDYKGPYYLLTSVSGGSATFDLGGYPAPPKGEVPYQIRRKPVKSSVSPLDIPEPLAIDIALSGIGLDGQFSATADGPIIISFAPGGGIHAVYTADSAPPTRPTGAIHLLVGWADKVGQGNENLEDMGTRWISVGHVTGRITTSENAGGASVREARAFAADAQGMGGGT
jgi:prepilin-type N-terminal cleavage/methylation domain-containing protein